jgi:hypothetical protein
MSRGEPIDAPLHPGSPKIPGDCQDPAQQWLATFTQLTDAH